MGAFDILGTVMDDPRTVLQFKCSNCGHQAVWKRDRAIGTFGSGAVPNDIRRRIKCGNCGEKSRVNAWI